MGEARCCGTCFYYQEQTVEKYICVITGKEQMFKDMRNCPEWESARGKI